jgi:thiazole/oxazole-forming peptide maturase SagD family component
MEVNNIAKTSVENNDEKLKTTLEKFRRAVPSERVYEFSTSALDHLGIPLYCVAVWTEDGTYYDGFGYGAGEAGAKIGAWGEVLESFYAVETLKNTPRVFASYKELQDKGELVIAPPTLCLNAGVEYSADKKLHWVKVNDLSGNKILVPLESVAVYPSQIPEIENGKWLYRPITNGLGAGASLAQAVAHGALETVQRDGNCVTFRALDLGQKIELDQIRNSETLRLLELLERENIEIIAKLAGIVADIPVIYVVGYDRDLSRADFSMTVSACGEAAHPDREIALNKALREYVSGRARKAFMHGTLDKLASVAPPEYVHAMTSEPAPSQESRALEAVLNWATATHEEIYRRIEKPILETRSVVKFSELPTTEFAAGDWDAILAHLQKKFAELDTKILYADFSETAPDGIYVTRVIVPKMEGETMSYGRIGRRNLERLLARQKADEQIKKMVGYGDDAPPGALKIHLNPEDDRKFPGAWLDPEAVAAQVGEFYALYREPESFSVGRVLRDRKTNEQKEQ